MSLSLAIYGLLGLGLVAERRWPRQRLPVVPGWYARLAVVTLLTMLVSAAAHALRTLLLGNWSLLAPGMLGGDDTLGVLQQAGAAAFVHSLLLYWYHRGMHRYGAFWRVHQLHHSVQRIEGIGGMFHHPFEFMVGALTKTLLVFLIIGGSAEVAATYTAIVVSLAVFSHLNIRTPRWLGYVLPRPESHYIHHEHERHGMNYGSLPLWDLLFGTFENGGARPIPRIGFEPWMEHRFDDLLALRDVHAPDLRDREPIRLLPACLGCSSRLLCRPGPPRVDGMPKAVP